MLITSGKRGKFDNGSISEQTIPAMKDSVMERNGVVRIRCSNCMMCIGYLPLEVLQSIALNNVIHIRH